MGGVSQDRFLSSACSIQIISEADGVSFVESLPRQFVVGKTGLVLVAVQGAPPSCADLGHVLSEDQSRDSLFPNEGD